eukprot:TRINITY_DN18738_c0_g1_i2.p1 TRINITY_DN18738_c0_g1~~TRINITY_DN18738_c0_g1_i2.p1  ORF type:complete len:566 (+),score=143.76 TRINITY_DN18738_c0_g1_i2:102-1700(+)
MPRPGPALCAAWLLALLAAALWLGRWGARRRGGEGAARRRLQPLLNATPAPSAGAAPRPAAGRTPLPSNGSGAVHFDAVTGWAAGVRWLGQREAEPLRPAALRRGPGAASAEGTLQLLPQWANSKVQGVNATPFCVEQGTGWVWPRGAPGPRVDLPVTSERQRSIAAQDRQVGQQVLWDHRPAFLSPIPTPGPPFHVAWNFVAVGLAFAALKFRPAVHYVQTMGSECWHEWGGNCCTPPPSRICVHCFAWALQSALALPLPAHDFLRAPPGEGNGTVVCHPWGVVAAANVMDQSKGTQLAGRRCKGFPKGMKRIPKHLQKQFCHANVRRVQRWQSLRWLRDRLQAGFGMAAVGPDRSRPSPWLGIISRRGSRRFSSLADMVEGAEQRGFNVSVVHLEDIPLQRQLALLAAADIVAGVHGSAFMWALFAPPGITWAEFAPGSIHAPQLSGHHRQIGVNQQSRGNYPALAAYAGASHIGWTAPNHMRGKSAGNWKSADVFVPPNVWARVLNVSRALWQGLPVCPGPVPECDLPV